MNEDRVWAEAISPALSNFPANVRDIWHYAVTEMVNNAIDHSGSETVTVELSIDALNTTVYVADEGEKLVSRSQAKRLTLRFERFQIVLLDFAGVEEIGQAFADEVFRVFANAHPLIKLTPINLTPAVEKIIKRALSLS